MIESYLTPSDDIRAAVQVLDQFYQYTHQEALKLYFKKGHKKTFKGFMHEFHVVKNLEGYFTDTNKTFGTLKQSLFLLANLEDQVPVRLFSMVPADERPALIDLFLAYGDAKDKIEAWTKAITDDDKILEATTDALELSLDKFQFLELATLDPGHKTEKISLMTNILQIDSVEALTQYLRVQKELRDCLMLTVVRNKRREWKSFFYMFLIYNGKLYSIDNSDRRVNQDNTEGDRSPGRYLERHYEDAGVWLPIHLVLGGHMVKSEALVTTHNGLYKIGSYDELKKSAPEYVYWIGMFLNRVTEAMGRREIKVPKGYTRDQLPLLLGQGQAPYKADSRAPVSSKEYLTEAYKGQSQALTIKPEQFSMVVGTKKHMQALVAYKARELQAKDIAAQVLQDFNKNHKAVYAAVRKLAVPKDMAKFVEKALRNLDYPIMVYSQFGMMNEVKGVCEPRQQRILSSGYHWWRPGEKHLDLGVKATHCPVHPDRKANKTFFLSFQDYRQFLAFYELEAKDIPVQMVQHLHQHASLYTGNSILDDTDPLDEVWDPWFIKDSHGGYQNDHPEFKVGFACCGYCTKKWLPKKA